jgi:hypothetical protein
MVLVGKPKGKSPMGRPRRRWEDNTKLHIQEMGWGGWTRFIWFSTGTSGWLL